MTVRRGISKRSHEKIGDCEQSTQCPPHYYTINPYETVIHFFTLFFKSRKKTNLLYFLNNVFQYSKIRTRKRNAKKSIKTEKKLESSPFRNPESTGWNLESKTVMDSLTWGEMNVLNWRVSFRDHDQCASHNEIPSSSDLE